MNFECGCDVRTKLIGDGCIKCNTGYYMEHLDNPADVAEMLSTHQLSRGQSEGIADEIYAPLLDLITILSEKIDELSRKIS